MALLIPGGGYFYMGNTLYGVASAIMELLLAFLLILSVVDMYQGCNPAEHGPGRDKSGFIFSLPGSGEGVFPGHGAAASG